MKHTDFPGLGSTFEWGGQLPKGKFLTYPLPPRKIGIIVVRLGQKKKGGWGV